MKNLSAENQPGGTLFSSPVKTILITWLIAGALDISGAIVVWSVILKKVTAAQICRGIASGVFGKAAFTGGPPMIVYGVLFHYTIALAFTVGYFLAFPYMPFLRKQKVISGLLYGAFAWAWVNYIILPFSQIHRSVLKLTNVAISIAILMVCIGLPISLMVHKYYEGRKAEIEI